MKKALAMLVAVAMVFTLVASVPGAFAEVSGKTWTIYDELLKATKDFGAPAEGTATVSGTADYSSSVFTVRSTTYLGSALDDLKGDGDRRTVTYNPTTGTIVFADTRSAGQNDAWRGSLTVSKDTGCQVSQESINQTMQIVFTAPTSGTYSVNPAATGKTGESLYTTYEYSDFKIQTERKTVADYSLVKGVDNGFSSSSKSVTLKAGEKIIFSVTPSACTAEHEPGGNVYGNPKGINTFFNFTVTLDIAKKSDEVYNTVYNPKDYLEQIMPTSAKEKTADGIAESETAVEVGKIYIPADTPAASNLFGIDLKSPWDGTRRGYFSYGAAGGLSNYYIDNWSNVGKYAMSITKDGTISTTTVAASITWRLFFTAPKAGTYLIDLGTVTAKASTNQDARLLVYTDAYDNGGVFGGTNDNLVVNVDFYAAKTSTLNPCADGPIAVTLNEGQKLYFQTALNENGNVETGWGKDVGITYSLSMLADKNTVNIKNNDKITLDKTVLTASGKLTATGVSGATAAKEIYWRTTDPTVATVDNSGNVTLTGKTGHCYIIAYNAFAEAKCLVNKDGSTTATGVSFKKDTLDLDTFGEFELVRSGDQATGAKLVKTNLNDLVTLSPAGSVAKNLTFEVDDPEVLAVLPSGEIIIRGEGEAVITVYLDGSEKDTLDVTVSEHECTTEKLDLIYKNVAVTCEIDGTETWSCPVCGKVVSSLTVTTPHPGHSWSEWKVTTPAGIGVAGEETRTCSVCTAKETRANAAGIVKEVVVKKAPTKAVYAKNATFDPAGMELEVSFTNYDHTVTVSDFTGYNFTYNFASENLNTPVTFKVGEKTVTVNVAVITKSGKIGDADKSGTVDNNDYITVMKYIMGYNPTIGLYNADANQDGALDILDAITILNMIA